MKDLKFDLYAMVHPKNSRDLQALAMEALAEIRAVNSKLDELLATEPCVPQHA